MKAKMTKKNVNYKTSREHPDNRESRLKETGGIQNWTPSDGKGVRQDTGVRGGEGQRFPQYRRPDNGK